MQLLCFNYYVFNYYAIIIKMPFMLASLALAKYMKHYFPVSKLLQAF